MDGGRDVFFVLLSDRSTRRSVTRTLTVVLLFGVLSYYECCENFTTYVNHTIQEIS